MLKHRIHYEMTRGGAAATRRMALALRSSPEVCKFCKVGQFDGLQNIQCLLLPFSNKRSKSTGCWRWVLL